MHLHFLADQLAFFVHAVLSLDGLKALECGVVNVEVDERLGLDVRVVAAGRLRADLVVSAELLQSLSHDCLFRCLDFFHFTFLSRAQSPVT